MTQKPPQATLRWRLSARRDDLRFCAGVALRDALRTAQSRLRLTTVFLWLGLGMALLAGLAWWLGGVHPNPHAHWGRAAVTILFGASSLAFFATHNEIKIRERRRAPHGD